MPDPRTPCDHPNCGSRTACCRDDCPIIMMQAGNGRWQWVRRGSPVDIPWPDGVRPNSRSSDNWNGDA
jgi:hypothetical protein